jgi:hypothetical protein
VPRDTPRQQPGRQHAAPVPAAAKPQQWFTLRPWLFDIIAATALLCAAPRTSQAQPLRVEPCTRLRAAPRPRRQPAHGPPDRPTARTSARSTRWAPTWTSR